MSAAYVEAPGRRHPWDTCAWGEGETSSASPFESFEQPVWNANGLCFLLVEKGDFSAKHYIPILPPPLHPPQVFPVVVLSNSIRRLFLDCILYSDLESICHSPQGHKKGRLGKASLVKKGGNREGQEGLLKRKGERRQEGEGNVELVNVNVI